MRRNNTGFTLIELLVVVALIGVLATLLVANLNAARERGRDAQRKSDLRNMQTALRLYFNDKGIYPAHDATSFQILGCGSLGTSSCAWGEIWSADSIVYMPTLPKDPLPSQTYRYQQTGSGDGYIIQACLENKSDDKGKAAGDTSWCTTDWMYQVIQ